VGLGLGVRVAAGLWMKNAGHPMQYRHREVIPERLSDDF